MPNITHIVRTRTVLSKRSKPSRGDAIAKIVAIAAARRRARRIAQARRRGREMATKLTQTAGDRRVRREARRTATAASRAAQRAQKVGMSAALSDRRVSRDLRRTRRHAARAASLAVQPRSHRARKAALIIAGTGALAGAAYAGTHKPE